MATISPSAVTNTTANTIKSEASTAVENPAIELKNKAGESRSPYVRGHASNPVAWQLWTQETLKLAKDQDRLIFLSVGYSACHCIT